MRRGIRLHWDSAVGAQGHFGLVCSLLFWGGWSKPLAPVGLFAVWGWHRWEWFWPFYPFCLRGGASGFGDDRRWERVWSFWPWAGRQDSSFFVLVLSWGDAGWEFDGNVWVLRIWSVPINNFYLQYCSVPPGWGEFGSISIPTFPLWSNYRKQYSSAYNLVILHSEDTNMVFASISAKRKKNSSDISAFLGQRVPFSRLIYKMWMELNSRSLVSQCLDQQMGTSGVVKCHNYFYKKVDANVCYSNWKNAEI